MNRLHLFYPENDLALALDLTNYTPPPAAVRLRRGGQTLPLWYGSPGDSFIATGVNAVWYDDVRRRFGIGVSLFDYNPGGLIAYPWGWSKASRRFYTDRGFDPESLPDDEALARIRRLSHRRTAAAVARHLRETTGLDLCQPAAELTGIKQVEDYVTATGHTMLKLPWSSSGRGLVATGPDTFARQKDMICGMLRRQGSVMGEPFYHKKCDFAMLFSMAAGRCFYEGLSLFSTDSNGAYTGNIIAGQEELEEMTGCACVATVREALRRVLEQVIGTDYDGPVGVDMMVLEDGRLNAAVEVNLRHTMGLVALRLQQRFVGAGKRGRFGVVAGARPADTSLVCDGLLHGGCLPLGPEGEDFNFYLQIDS